MVIGLSFDTNKKLKNIIKIEKNSNKGWEKAVSIKLPLSVKILLPHNLHVCQYKKNKPCR